MARSRFSAILGVLLALAAVACDPPDPAPEDLSSLLRFAFSHYPATDPDNDVSLADAGVNLLRWYESDVEAAEGFDPEEGYGASLVEEADRLGEEELSTLDPRPEGVEGADAVGVVFATGTACSLLDYERIYLDDDQMAFFPDSYLSYGRRSQDYGCFQSGDCVEATWISEIEKNLFGNLDASFDLRNQFRRLEGEAPDGTVVRARLVRAWLEGEAELSDPDVGRWAQNYQLEFIIETGDGVLHVYPQWVEVDIEGINTEAGWLLGQYVQGLRDYVHQAESHCGEA